jgi:hypothetical protein
MSEIVRTKQRINLDNVEDAAATSPPGGPVIPCGCRYNELLITAGDHAVDIGPGLFRNALFLRFRSTHPENWGNGAFPTGEPIGRTGDEVDVKSERRAGASPAAFAAA